MTSGPLKLRLSKLNQLLFPGEDRSAYMQSGLQEQLQLAMHIVGAVSVILPLTSALSIGVADIAGVHVFDEHIRQIAVAGQVSSLILGITLYLLARRISTPGQGKMVLSLFAVLSCALVVRQGLLLGSDPAVPTPVIPLLLVIAVSPFRPKESWGLGALTIGVFVLVTSTYPVEGLADHTRAMRLVIGTVPLIVLIIGGGVLSAVLYQYRSEVAKVHAERSDIQARMSTLAEVTEVSPVPTMRFHLDGRLLWASPAALQYSAKVGAPSRTIEDYLPSGFNAGIPEATGGGAQTQMVSTYEAHHRYFNVNYKPIPGQSEFIVTLADVTNETRARRKAERFSEELRQAQVKLVQTEKMASLGNLVAGVAHEVNTPLGAMKSNNQVLMRSMQKLDELDPDDTKKRDQIWSMMKKLFEVNEEAIHRIHGIVDSLRRFARLDQSERGDMDVCVEIENTLTLVRHETKNRVGVHRDFHEVPLLNCFANQINQVFMNLIVNAIQAIEGPGDVYITVEHVGAVIKVTVRDTGCGIPKDKQDKIFDPGFTTKGVGIGTGLGLSIVHRIVEDHEGRIDVHSVDGKGATFIVWLPLELGVTLPSAPCSP